jgi:Holliday junction DNA helicase RuvA
MYAFFKGIVSEKGMDYVVLDVHDVGYLIRVSTSTLQLLPGLDQEAKLYTYTSVHEDDISLYGFLTRDELNLFRQLINVNGIGPKGGQSILSVMTADAIRIAIISGDAKAIAKAPGIGIKTAQRVLLDLRDKIKLEETLGIGEGQQLSGDERTAPSEALREAVEALVALGYSSSEAAMAVRKVENPDQKSTESILKEALKHIF